MSRKFTLIAGAALLLTLGRIGSACSQSSDWPESQRLREEYGLPSGFTAAQLKAAVGTTEVLGYETKYGLKPGWTEAQFCQAVGTIDVAFLRVRYNLMPGFTAQDYAQAYADVEVNSLIKLYNLPPNFTEDQLRQSVGRARVEYAGNSDTGWGKRPAFFAWEFADAAGSHGARKIARKYQLSDHWDYGELRDSAGPEEAAQIAWRNGFGRKDNHTQIVKSIGQTALTQYAKVYKLTDHFTPGELISAFGESEIRFYREDMFHEPGAVVDEAWLIAQYKARALSNFRYEHPSADPDFTEASLLAAIGAEGCKSLRDRYGLEPGFTEADVAEAIGASAVAKIRHEYSLPKDFEEDDLLAAEPTVRKPWDGSDFMSFH